MKKTLIALSAISIFFISCKEEKFSGYEQTPGGIYYREHISGTDTAKPQPGDLIELWASYGPEGKDTVLFSSDKLPQPFEMPMQTPKYDGDIFEGIAMMNAGDSTTFLMKADSFYARMGEPYPEFLDTGAYLKWNIKLKKITPKEIAGKIMEERRQKQQSDMQDKIREAFEAEPELINEYIRKNKITERPSESGLYYIEKKKGTGPVVKAGDQVVMAYEGRFLNGEVFDASERHGRPFTFVAGRGEVIRGWDEAVLKMRKGTKATLIIPSALGYGVGVDSGLPPYATLVFDVEVIDITTPTNK